LTINATSLELSTGKVHIIQLFASKTKRANKIHKRKGKTLRKITFGEEY
jgi:hypothetical protein